MMTHIKSLSEVNHEAIRLLSEQIGIVDTMRFINQFTTGHGDYTEERQTRFGHLSLDEIVSGIERQRSVTSGGDSPNPTGDEPTY